MDHQIRRSNELPVLPRPQAETGLGDIRPDLHPSRTLEWIAVGEAADAFWRQERDRGIAQDPGGSGHQDPRTIPVQMGRAVHLGCADDERGGGTAGLPGTSDPPHTGDMSDPETLELAHWLESEGVPELRHPRAIGNRKDR